MNKRRLLKLADLLEADAKNKKGIKFDLGTWARPANARFERKEKTVPVDCNTVACAVGLACISGAFKREGLSHSYKSSALGGYYLVPKLGRLTDMAAAARLFGLKIREAEFLFYESSYPDGKTRGAAGERFVAKRIRDFASGKN